MHGPKPLLGAEVARPTHCTVGHLDGSTPAATSEPNAVHDGVDLPQQARLTGTDCRRDALREPQVALQLFGDGPLVRVCGPRPAHRVRPTQQAMQH
eukprot:13915713-Alexandrium_andersonii.AAC.1